MKFNEYLLRDTKTGHFYTEDALSLRKNLGKHFVVRLVMRLKYIKRQAQVMLPGELPP